MTYTQRNAITETADEISLLNTNVKCFIRLIYDVLNTPNHAWTIEKLSCISALADGMERLTTDISDQCETLFCTVMQSKSTKKNKRNLTYYEK